MSTTTSDLGGRPTKSAGAAAVGVVLSLALFVITFIAFLIAPLIVLLLGYLVYVAMKSRDRGDGPVADETGEDGEAHGHRHEDLGATAFGSGAS